MIKAIGFDLDDCLIQTFDTAVEEFKHIVALWNETERPKLVMKQRSVFAEHYRGSFEDWISLVWPELDGKAKNLADFFYEKRPRGAFFPPVEGAKDALKYVHDNDYVCGILTGRNRNTIEKVVKDAGIHPYIFHFLCSTHDVGENCTKIHPMGFEPLTKSLEVHSVAPEEAMYIGDQIDDKNCEDIGVKFVAVCTGVVPREIFLKYGVNGSDILPSVACLPTYIESMR